MKGLLDSALIGAALLTALVWTRHPLLAPYTLQLLAACVVAYVVLVRWRARRWHHVLPQAESVEGALLAGAMALLIGRTGGLDSPFLPLAHVLLFVTVLTLDLGANVIHAVGLTLFLWAAGPHPLTQPLWISLLSLPAVLPLMMLARIELETARYRQMQEKHTEAVLAGQETRALLFLETFLRPKLAALRTFLESNPQHADVAARQVRILESAAEAAAKDIDEASEQA